jgi:two-component system, LytTR family, sensor kinase
MKKSFIIVLHIGYWLLYLLLLSMFILFLRAGGLKNPSQNSLQVMVFIKIMCSFTLIPAVISFYTFYKVLFKRYLSHKKIISLCVAGLATIIFAGSAGLLTLGLATNGILIKYNKIGVLVWMVVFMSTLALIHGIIALVMKGFINWYDDIKIKQELKQKNFETELALVKSQLSPHFLFNSINNLDVLIEKNPGHASVYLNKLADIMRFMLYETKTEMIPLIKELNYINKYIDLQKIRTSNNNFVKYSAEGDPSEWKIAPMLFIPFIENAFKHSVNKKTDQGILINIKITSGSLIFYCENHFSETLDADYEAGGLGNELIKKRLSLLYPGLHELKIEKQHNIYKLWLTVFKNEN